MGMPGLSPERLGEAVGAVGQEFMLDPATAWQARSGDGGLSAAGIHHGEAAMPRRYLSRGNRTITLFDGLPVDPEGRRAAHDAEQIADGWNAWARELEGQFCAARIDLDGERVELLLDSFGHVPVFVAQRDGGALASNSVQVIRSLLKLDSPDPLGVSSMIGFGWAWSDRTLLSGVRPLAGGSVHVLEGGQVTTRTHFGPHSIERDASSVAGAEELCDFLETLTESAVAGIEPVRCALTAGRDSRLLLALLRAGGVTADYYTIGRVGEEDVDYAQELAVKFGLSHRLLTPKEDDPGIDWDRIAAGLITQNDGMSSLAQLTDYLDLSSAPQRLGIKLGGIGAEIGRAGPGDMSITIANVPLLGRSSSVQRRALMMKTDPFTNLMTPEARVMLEHSVNRFCADRFSEGWRVNEMAELFYTFERVVGWGSTGPRRAAVADDLFSPYCSRRYAEYCLGLSPAQRYVELPYHRLISRLSPQLRDHRFAIPLRPPRPRRAGWRATRKLTRTLVERSGLRTSKGNAPAQDGWPFVFEWFERHLDFMRELCAEDSSALWQVIDRERINDLLHGTREQRYPQLDGLLRVATVLWYFHGPTLI
jgi:asparagine synthase (glutamine-hydrolysing)